MTRRALGESLVGGGAGGERLGAVPQGGGETASLPAEKNLR